MLLYTAIRERYEQQRAMWLQTLIGYGKETIGTSELLSQDNAIVERVLGKYGLICVEDIILRDLHSGTKFQGEPHTTFSGRSSSATPGEALGRRIHHFIEGGDHGNRELLISQAHSKNELIDYVYRFLCFDVHFVIHGVIFAQMFCRTNVIQWS